MQLVDVDIETSKLFLVIRKRLTGKYKKSIGLFYFLKNALLFPFLFITLLLTTVSSLAIPSVPSAGLVTVMVLLTTLNIPIEAASLLFALEWF
ncbi:hypothetical protein KUTeg_023257, partial [Tegillarca granosa]